MVKANKKRYSLTSLKTLEQAHQNQISNLQVLVRGRVVSLLSDDTLGDRHQRFILELPNGHTLLVAHNIDVSPRVTDLKVGSSLYAYGEYEWNAQGGVIHWTHHDPQELHIDGWIDHNGTVFR